MVSQKTIGYVEVAGGLFMALVGVLPTPDDITVISPVAQVSVGLGMIIDGLSKI